MQQIVFQGLVGANGSFCLVVRFWGEGVLFLCYVASQ